MASAAHTILPYGGWEEGAPMQADAWVSTFANVRNTQRCVTIGFQDFHVATRIDRDQFDEAYMQWLEDSAVDSLPQHMRAHASYAAIVALGDSAIPVIAAELRKQPSFLFLALEDIIGEDPIPEEAQGNLYATIETWLAWLRK